MENEHLEKELYEVKIVLARIEEKLDGYMQSTNRTTKDHEERIRNLESKAGKRWETLVGDIIKLCIAAGFGYFISK